MRSVTLCFIICGLSLLCGCAGEAVESTGTPPATGETTTGDETPDAAAIDVSDVEGADFLPSTGDDGAGKPEQDSDKK